MENFLTFFDRLISGFLPFTLLLGCGIYLTVKSGFYQFKNLFSSLKYALGDAFKKKDKSGISPFQAACTALSATVGTGNIAGVAGALSLGGAGAVFWMWVSAFAGMIVKVAEILLSINYRKRKNGEWLGGPMLYISNGLPKAFAPLAFVFSVVGIPAVFFSGNLTQANAAAATLTGAQTRFACGLIFMLITAIVTYGGVKRIGIFTEKLVPIMALLYIALSFGVIFSNLSALPYAFKTIFAGALNPRAATGGAIGSLATTVISGASRGVFSNEAGLGTSGMAHAASERTDGAKQGLYGIFEVFVDTFLICTLTALTVLCTEVKIPYGITASTELVNSAFSTVYGPASVKLLSLMMCLFAVSSIIGWGYYGIVCAEFIFGAKGNIVFKTVYPVFCIAGVLCSAETAWRLSALFNGIMLCVNVFAVSMLSDTFLKLLKFNNKSKPLCK